jgi:hypothetical protein
MVGYHGGRFNFPVLQFGILMKMPAPFHYLLIELIRLLINVVLPVEAGAVLG